MGIKVIIPGALHAFTRGQAEVSAEGKTVMEVVEYLDRQYPGFRERICDQDGNLRRFINLFVNDESVRSGNSLHTEVSAGDELLIVTALAGG